MSGLFRLSSWRPKTKLSAKRQKRQSVHQNALLLENAVDIGKRRQLIAWATNNVGGWSLWKNDVDPRLSSLLLIGIHGINLSLGLQKMFGLVFIGIHGINPSLALRKTFGLVSLENNVDPRLSSLLLLIMVLVEQKTPFCYAMPLLTPSPYLVLVGIHGINHCLVLVVYKIKILSLRYAVVYQIDCRNSRNQSIAWSWFDKTRRNLLPVGN